MKIWNAVILILPIIFLFVQPVAAHQNNCHLLHSCPPHNSAYVCGDLGYCSGCSNNAYCKNGRASITGNQISKKSPVSNGGRSALCKGSALCYTGTVKRIVDGDTLIIGNYKIRLALVNTPESDEAGYKESVLFTKNLCPVGSTATADQDDFQKKDKYGRTVAVVYCQGKNLNQQLLEKKYAKILKDFCRASEFRGERWATAYGC